MTARFWDAATYDRVSDPQVEMARAVLDRLELRGDETVLDAGCGSGRVTEVLLERVARGRVIAVDADAAMVGEARAKLAGRADVRQASLLDLDLDGEVDAVFSNAVLHWILDHERLFERLHAALRPGGRLSAQCGGRGNIARVKGAADDVLAERGLPHPGRTWHYADPVQSRARLAAAGFEEPHAWLQSWDVQPAEPAAYLESVVLGPYVQTLDEPDRKPFVAAVLDRLGDPPTLDYVRLNLLARRLASPRHRR